MTVDEDWGKRIEARIAQLESIAGNDPDNAEIDEMIRKAFRAWLALGWGLKWVIYILAASAGALTAWKTVLAETKTWMTGG